MNSIALILIIASFSASLTDDAWKPQKMAAPPRVFVDKGACPGEGCRYVGTLKIRKTTFAYARPDESSPKRGQFIAGNDAVPLTG